MVLSAFLALSLFAPQDSIKLDLKATSIASVLEQLDAKTGAKLKASAALGQEIVLVRVDGVSITDLKTRIAEVMTASWKVKDDGEYLERTPDQQREIWNQHLAARSAMVDKALDGVRKQVEKPFDAKYLANGLANLRDPADFNDDRAGAMAQSKAQTALFSAGPMSRLIRKLLLACDKRELAAIGPHERRIFRLSPTRMQRGFNANLFNRAMAEFQREQQEWVEAAAKTTFPQEKSGRMVTDPRSQLQYGIDDLKDLRLEVRRGEMVGLFFANLYGRSEDYPGARILSQADFADDARTYMNAQMNPTAGDDADPVVKLSPDSERFQARLLEVFGGKAAQAMTPEMRALVIDVDKHEPLGLTASDVLATYADHKNLNLVAALPDQALSAGWFMTLPGQQMRAKQVLQSIVVLNGLELRETEKWALLLPKDRWEFALDFTPRGPVTELMKAVDAKQALDMRDYARYAYRSGRGWRMGLGDIWIGLYSRALLGASDFNDWNSVRLYGSFNAAGQRDLESGKQFPFMGLNPEQRKIVEAIVYAGPIASETRETGNMTRQGHEPVEPTDMFANGVPSDAYVTGSTKALPVLVAYGKGADGVIRPLRSVDPWTIATIELDVVGNPQRMEQYGVTGLVGYAPGQEKMISLRVFLAAGIWKESTFRVPEYDTKATPVAWNKLPEASAKAVADGIENLKQRKQQQGGGTIPPCSFVN